MVEFLKQSMPILKSLLSRIEQCLVCQLSKKGIRDSCVPTRLVLATSKRVALHILDSQEELMFK